MTSIVSPPPDADRIRTAYEKVCRALLDRRTPEGHWIGRLSDSALSTATAVSAFSIFYNSIRSNKHDLTASESQQLETFIQQGADWLLAHQNPDGGWGDTDKSLSNVSTTLLVKSALVLAERTSGGLTPPVSTSKESFGGKTGGLSPPLVHADEYLRLAGGIDAIKKRYGSDQTFSVPILTNAALAGLAEWKEIPQLPFELAAFPMSWFRFLKMNVVSYAVPALVAIGQVRFHFAPEKRIPFANFFRRLVQKHTLRLIQNMQPESGGYLEAAPLTAFVVMSLSAMGLTDHPIVTKGIRFLLQTVREDGSWSIDTNLATWLTSLSISALQNTKRAGDDSPPIDWLISCQHTKRHPFTGASPGGWGWTNLSGAVPDADDTSAALLALLTDSSLTEPPSLDCAVCSPTTQSKNCGSDNVIAGIYWLLGLQNWDGGIPTFCQGWGMLPFDQSSTDITAHTIKAFQAWQNKLTDDILKRKMERAVERMLAFLERTQQKDGSWLPLWFGNQFMPDDANPYYGTAKVLTALTETKHYDIMTLNGLRYLVSSQNPDGGWGRHSSSVEETAVVVESLSSFADRLEVASAYYRGLDWLLESVESDRFLQSSPIGLYFAKLWYYEDLYPIIFTASALRRAVKTIDPTLRFTWH